MANEEEEIKVLKHVTDNYNGVVITDEICFPKQPKRGAPIDLIQFEKSLWHSLSTWRKKRRKGVWLKIGQSQAELIPIAVRAGFQFHSATAESLTLTAWLSSEHKNKLPPRPNHFVGVAGFVLNSKNELLCIKEKSGPSAKIEDFWKLPGGLVDHSEDIAVAAIREVKEETGIDTTFVRMSTIQEIHHATSDREPSRSATTDLYIICVLRAVDENQAIVPQPDEIAACEWRPLDAVLRSTFYSNPETVFNKAFHTAAKVAAGQAPGLAMERLELGFRPIKNAIYFASQPSRL